MERYHADRSEAEVRCATADLCGYQMKISICFCPVLPMPVKRGGAVTNVKTLSVNMSKGSRHVVR